MPLVLPVKVNTTGKTDSLVDVAWPRKIEKHGNTLQVISLDNPTDCAIYTLHFINFASDPINLFSILYGDDHGNVIIINPVIPVVTIGINQYY